MADPHVLVVCDHASDLKRLASLMPNNRPLPRDELDKGHVYPGRYDAVVCLGSDDDDFRSSEVTLVRAVLGKRPFLGICHGAQVLACVLWQRWAGHKGNGRGIEQNDSRHEGPRCLCLCLDARDDPVLRHYTVGTKLYQSHGWYSKLRDNAVCLAWSGDGNPNHVEAFKARGVTPAAYGLQFHPEHEESDKTGEDMLRAWYTLATGATG